MLAGPAGRPLLPVVTGLLGGQRLGAFVVACCALPIVPCVLPAVAQHQSEADGSVKSVQRSPPPPPTPPSPPRCTVYTAVDSRVLVYMQRAYACWWHITRLSKIQSLLSCLVLWMNVGLTPMIAVACLSPAFQRQSVSSRRNGIQTRCRPTSLVQRMRRCCFCNRQTPGEKIPPVVHSWRIRSETTGAEGSI